MTLLPYASFIESIQVLNRKDLAFQIAQCVAIMRCKDKTHPSVLMWNNNENALREYYNLCLVVAKRRGSKVLSEKMPITLPVIYPKWMGDSRLHSSHRYFLQKRGYLEFQEVPQDLFWPVKLSFDNEELL